MSDTLETSPNCNISEDCYCISNFPSVEVILRTIPSTSTYHELKSSDKR